VYDSKTFDPSGNPSHADPEFREFYEKYENTVDPGVLYPKLMVRYLPPGLVGLLIAVFLAAYMSTISSQLNWGTSYLINDFYRRFIRRKAPERHYVLASRLGIVLMMVFSLVVTRFFLTTISGAWVFMINASAGIGTVLILRWFWWRVNAWSEIAAMAAPLVIYPVSKLFFHLESPLTLYPVVAGTTAVWLVVTFLTRPTDRSTLKAFYAKVHPGGSGWKPVRKECPGVVADEGMGNLFVNWLCGIVLVYSFLFGAGALLFGKIVSGSILLAVGILAAGIIALNLKKHSVF
jgi:SSS family solute:Na+ symporter